MNLQHGTQFPHHLALLLELLDRKMQFHCKRLFAATIQEVVISIPGTKGSCRNNLIFIYYNAGSQAIENVLC